MIPISALATQWPGEVFLALTGGLFIVLVLEWRALCVHCTKIMTLALRALGEASVAFGTFTTLVTSVLFFAFTSASIMITTRISKAGWTVALGTGVFRFHWLRLIAIVARCTAFTVIALGIVFAWSTNTATAILTCHVQRGLGKSYIFIVITAICMVVTVALNTLVDLTTLCMLPFVLIVKWKTFATRNAHCIMFTLT